MVVYYDGSNVKHIKGITKKGDTKWLANAPLYGYVYGMSSKTFDFAGGCLTGAHGTESSFGGVMTLGFYYSTYK